MNSSRPPGRSTRRSSRSARGWSSTPHSTSVETATSKVSSSNGRSSAGARSTLAADALCTDLAFQAAQHRRLGLGDRQRLDGRAVEAQVGARSRRRSRARRRSRRRAVAHGRRAARPSRPWPSAGRTSWRRTCSEGSWLPHFVVSEIAADTNVTRRPGPAHEANTPSSPPRHRSLKGYAWLVGEGTGGPHVRLAELVAALSLGVDLGFGQPMEHVLRQCLIALRLAERVGLGRQAPGGRLLHGAAGQRRLSRRRARAGEVVRRRHRAEGRQVRPRAGQRARARWRRCGWSARATRRCTGSGSGSSSRSPGTATSTA